MLVCLYRGRHPLGNYPQLIINSVDLKHAIDLIERDRDGLIDMLVASIEQVARAGADFGAMLSVTPHIVFEEVAARSPIALISIVQTACDRAREKQMSRLALFGTRFTMEADFYHRAFAPEKMNAKYVPGRVARLRLATSQGGPAFLTRELQSSFQWQRARIEFVCPADGPIWLRVGSCGEEAAEYTGFTLLKAPTEE